MKDRSAKPRIYLAGPDVFFPDSKQIFQNLLMHCERFGMVGLVPSDGGIADGFVGPDDELAQRIYDGNVALMRKADGVIANLMSFRGAEPDSGTAFEVGFAAALQKPVVVYGVPEGTYASRVAAVIPTTPDADGNLRETASGLLVEGLGQRMNLMLTRSTAMAPSAQAALAMLRDLLDAA
ncbi:nucleoside 2-deoxyribosyltransferase [soil metagenome]